MVCEGKCNEFCEKEGAEKMVGFGGKDVCEDLGESLGKMLRNGEGSGMM